MPASLYSPVSQDAAMSNSSSSPGIPLDQTCLIPSRFCAMVSRARLARRLRPLLFLAAFAGFFLPDCARAQNQPRKAFAARTVETILSGSDWKLGSFGMDEGERQGVFRQEFDDRDFRVVRVPGEVQVQQIGRASCRER